MSRRKYEQRARAAAAGQTRRRILDAMLDLLRRVPPEGVSADAVARAAGVARSTIYVVFGSRAGLFDALAQDVMDRTGFARIVAAGELPDARDHLRTALRASCEMFAAERDVARAMFSTAALDPEAVAGAIQRIEQARAGGMAHLAGRLAEQGLLRPEVSVDEAADVLWTLTSFDAFDLLYTGRSLPPATVADRLIATAERALLQ